MLVGVGGVLFKRKLGNPKQRAAFRKSLSSTGRRLSGTFPSMGSFRFNQSNPKNLEVWVDHLDEFGTASISSDQKTIEQASI